MQKRQCGITQKIGQSSKFEFYGEINQVKTKAFVIMTILSVIALCFSGCEDTNDTPSCRLTVSSSYSEYGIDGQNLGSGTFTDAFTVSTGDEFYEDFNGHWTVKNKKIIKS